MGNEDVSQEVVSNGKSAAVFVFKGSIKSSISLTKLALKAIKAYQEGKGDVRGEQRIKDLSAKNTDKSTLELKGKIEGFDKFAKQYGIDYAAVYDKQKNQTLLVFQSKDNATLDKAFQSYHDNNIAKGKESIVDKIIKIEAAQVAAPAAAAAKGIGKAAEAGAKVAKQALSHAEHAR